MHRFALKMNPDEFQAIATQAYIEMAKAGYTAVGEFHYLHHQSDGSPYADPAEMGLRCLAAAEASGLAITLLPTLYMQEALAVFHRSPASAASLTRWTVFARSSRRCRRQGRKIHGISLHSLRAVPIAAIRQVLAEVTAGPVHLHIAEQTREVEDCLAATGRRPLELLLDLVELTSR